MKTIIIAIIATIMIGCNVVSDNSKSVQIDIDCCRYTGIIDFAQMSVVSGDDTVVTENYFSQKVTEHIDRNSTNYRTITVQCRVQSGSDVEIRHKYYSDGDWITERFVAESDTVVSIR